MTNIVEPIISVVIPTRHRPSLVVRALESVLAQTYRAIEVLVVVDGPDEATVSALQQVNDSRLRVIVLPENQGDGDARNIGVNEARCPWIAFLDDDDLWLPRKLDLQLETAQQSCRAYPVVGCHVIVRSELGDLIWPRRTPRPNEHLGEYLFCQHGLLGGEGSLIPTMILTARDLVTKVPFTRGMKRHNDIDWLLRARNMEGMGVEFVATSEPLAVWHVEENRSRLSNVSDWRYSVSWIQANRSIVTPRAYAGFLLTWVSRMAARDKDWKGFWLLLREAVREGRPNAFELLAHFVIWFVPRKLRGWMTRRLDDGHRSTRGR